MGQTDAVRSVTFPREAQAPVVPRPSGDRSRAPSRLETARTILALPATTSAIPPSMKVRQPLATPRRSSAPAFRSLPPVPSTSPLSAPSKPLPAPAPISSHQAPAVPATKAGPPPLPARRAETIPDSELVECEDTDANATANSVAPPPRKRGVLLKVVLTAFAMATLAGGSLAAWGPSKAPVSAAASQAAMPLASASRTTSASSQPRGLLAATNHMVAVSASAKKKPVKARAPTHKSAKRAHKAAGKPAKPTKRPRPAA